jgi:thioredoxin-related protein
MNRLFQFGSLMLVALVFASFMPTNNTPTVEGGDAVKWYSWEEAVAANKKKKKKIFVDVYTDWCGWCKKMDKTTFSDPAIVKHMNDNFYCVKLDAEQKGVINYNGHPYKFVANYGRKGVHEFAFTLLDGTMSYPQYVFLDESESKLIVSKGYKQVDDFMKELKYISSNSYKETSLDTYKSKAK